jgi:hypothetical protein
MNMPVLAIVYAVLLIVLGIGGYVLTGAASVTALIPAFLGGAVLIAGLTALNDRYRKHAMHAAALLALIGLAGTAPGLAKLFSLIAGGELERPEAVISQSIMALLSLAFFGLCLKSFLDARRARRS